MSGPESIVPVGESADDRSIGEVLGEVTSGLSTLLRQEVELAKAELRESASRAGKGSGLLGGAGVAGWFAVLFGSLALWWAIGQAVGLGWSALVVAALWAIVAAVLGVAGRAELARIRGVPQTAETIAAIPQALKPDQENHQ